MNLTLHASKAMARFIKKQSKIEIERLLCDDPALVDRVPNQSSPVNLDLVAACDSNQPRL